MRYMVFVVGTLALLGGCKSEQTGRKVRVAAASDLARAFDELSREFHQRTGIQPEITYGSSGLLAKQIEQGAPYFLFAAANRGFVDQVIGSGRCDRGTAAMYARGRIGVWTRAGVTAPRRLEDLADARFARIAIANPDHAPYGTAAQEALTRLGLWSKLERRIVLGENVQATMLYARQGDADAAIVALSLAVVTDGGSFLPIDPSLHTPLDQQLVVCGNGEEADAARRLAEFIASRDGREVMTRYGFVLPEPTRR